MLHNFFRTCFLIYLLINDSTQWVNLYGEKTSTYPKSTCSEIPYNVLSAASCFQKCLGTLRIHYMFSYSNDQQTCMCCADLSGDDLVSPQWNSFVPGEWKDKNKNEHKRQKNGWTPFGFFCTKKTKNEIRRVFSEMKKINKIHLGTIVSLASCVLKELTQCHFSLIHFT